MSYTVKELTSQDLEQLRAAETDEETVTYGQNGASNSIISVLSVIRNAQDHDEDNASDPQNTTSFFDNVAKAIFRFRSTECCEYKIILYQQIVDEDAKGFVVYEACEDDEEVQEAFDALQSTLRPLLYEGKVRLIKELLEELVTPEPMEPSKIRVHLMEMIKQRNLDTHPEWHAVIETLNSYFKYVPSPPRQPLSFDFSSSEETITEEISESFIVHPRRVQDEVGVPVWGLVQSKAQGMLVKHVGGVVNTIAGHVENMVGKRGFSGLEKINIPNGHGETPLMIAVNKKYVEYCMYLLLGGSDPNLVHPSTGNTSLHLAVLQENTTLVKMLLVFDAKVAATNKVGKTALDCAKESGDKEIQEILELADKRQKKSKLYFESNTSVPEPRGSKDIYLLSMDGGGIRAFNIAQALVAIESRMQQLSPKCEPFISYFDYVAGTSSGGIAALVLAYTDATPYTSRAVVYKIITDVFAKSRNRRGCKMKQYLQEILPENLCMADVQSPRVIVTSTLANRCPCKLHLMTNYGDTRDEQLGGLSPKERKVWEAGRATSAAPHHFPPFKKYFLDGGIMANNPTVDAMTEVLAKLKEEKSDSALTCVLSLGTGSTQPTDMDNVDVFLPGFNWKTLSKIPKAVVGSINLFTMICDHITHADGEEVTRAKSWCDSINCDYFRLSYTLEKDIDPDTTDIDKIVDMLFDTEMHLLNCPEKIDKIAKKLLSK